MSEERLTNFVLFVILDSMLESWENGLEEERQNFLQMRQRPECITYIVNWVKAYKKFIRQTASTLHNPELERLVMDGVRLSYAHYYNDDKLFDGTKTSAYAKEMAAYYKSDIAERKEAENA